MNTTSAPVSLAPRVPQKFAIPNRVSKLGEKPTLNSRKRAAKLRVEQRFIYRQS